MRPNLIVLLSACCLAGMIPAAGAEPAAHANKLDKIQHIIVISLENHSFDNLFGHFSGAEGIDEAKQVAQTNLEGVVYKNLPPVMDTNHHPPVADTHFPPHLPNHPFLIDPYLSTRQKTGDLVHRFYQEQEQIHDGSMDHFAAISDAGGLTMGYYDGSDLNLWRYAKEYTLADHFFHAAFGGSFLNHFWMICACTPHFDHAPPELVAQHNAKGKLTKDGAVTEDGYAVNTLYPTYTPHPASTEKAKLLPPQDMPTIGERLTEKHISWAWYSGGWNDAVAGHPSRLFEFHHQPFVYFKAYGDGKQARKEHLKDEAELLKDLKQDTLPAVVFYKPLGEFDLHPGYADVASGDAHAAAIIHAIETSNAWKSSVIIVTFDENGGYWDHVAPPVVDRWGPGVRVPAIIISPFAKKHFVDHTQYDTTSILKLIETRFGLDPLGTRDAIANDLSNTLAD